MPEIRGGNHSGIQVLFVGKQFVNVFVTFRRVLWLQRADMADTGLAIVIPDVTHRLEAQAGNVFHGVKQDLSLLAVADERDVEFLGRADIRGAQDARRAEHQARAGADGGFREKVATADR